MDTMLYIGKLGTKLPAFEWLARPIYLKFFGRPYDGNGYYGMYRSRAEAESAAPATMLHTYDQPAATCKYQSEKVRASDYPVVYWLSRIFGEGNDKVFDLGGHLGQAYYGFSGYLEYPDGLEWRVQDVPAVVEAGRQRALTHDPDKRLTFTNDFTDADGCDVLITTGALQYLETSLPEMLQGLVVKPTHVLVNMVPLHPRLDYFTLQNMGIAICPYRVMCLTDFVREMLALEYDQVDHWELSERHLQVPFEPSGTIDCYHGFYFRLISS